MGEVVTFPSNGGTGQGYLARPAQGRGPGLVVIHEWWGLVDHMRDVAERFAQAGFFALVPDLYHGATTSEPDEAQKLRMELQMDRAARDMSGAVDYLLQLEGVAGMGLGVVGFCMGGALAQVLATLRPEIRAAVPFYGLP